MAITSTTIDLVFCPAVDEQCMDHYDIYNANGDVLLGTTDSEDFTYRVTGLSPLTSYTFYAIAVDCAGNESLPSNNITVSTNNLPSPQPPDDVINLAVFNVTDTTANISWDAIVDWGDNPMGGYNIYHSNGTLFHQTVGVNAYYDPTNLVASTTYNLKVKAYDSLGIESANFSNTITFTTDPTPAQVPTTPTNLVIVDTHAYSVDLSWDASTFPNGVGGYTVHDELGTLLSTIPTSQTTWTEIGLSSNTTYSFKVRAYGADTLVSGFSNIVTTTTTTVVETTNNYGSVASFIPSFGSDWVNVPNILSSGSGASSVIPAYGETDRLYANGFGFAIPGTAIVTGIQMEVYRGALYGYVNGGLVQLMTSNVPIGNPKYFSGTFNTLGELKTYGWDSDMWGTTLTAADVNSPFFGCSLICSNGSVQDEPLIDYLRLKVFYVMP